MRVQQILGGLGSAFVAFVASAVLAAGYYLATRNIEPESESSRTLLAVGLFLVAAVLPFVLLLPAKEIWTQWFGGVSTMVAVLALVVSMLFWLQVISTVNDCTYGEAFPYAWNEGTCD
jgi:hypothetical protein